MTHSALQEHIESLLSRCRERDQHLTQQGIEDLSTDGCAAKITPRLIAAEIQTERQRRFLAVFIGEAR